MSLLTVLAFVFCFWNLHSRGFWWDEVATWHDALSGHRNPQEAPLNDWLARLAMTLLRSNDDYALHVADATCGALTVPAAFFLGYACSGPLAGLLTATLTLISPTLLYYAHEARPYPLLVLSTTLLLAFAVRMTRVEWRSRDLVGFSILAAAACASQLVALPFVAALAVVVGLRQLLEVVAHPGERRAVLRLVALVASVGAGIALGSSWILFRPPFTSVMAGRYTLGLGHFVRFVLIHSGPRIENAARPLDRLDVTLAVYVAFALVAIVAMARSGRGWVLACVCLAPLANLVGLYLQLGDKSTWTWFKYATPVVVPFLALVAIGLSTGSRRRVAAACALFAFVVQADVRAGLRVWTVVNPVRRGSEFVEAAKIIAADPRFVGTIFVPQESVFGDESDRLIGSYALGRRDRLPSYFARKSKPLTVVEWRPSVGALEIPVRTDREAPALAPGRYAVFLGWDVYRGCSYLSPALQDPPTVVKGGAFYSCVVPR